MLYQTVAEHWPAFLERAEEQGVRLNVHMHALVLDGVYIHEGPRETEGNPPGAPLEFLELDTPTSPRWQPVPRRASRRS